MTQLNEETAKLILKHLEGKADQDQTRQLNELLAASREARAYYAEIISIHAMLRSMYNEKSITHDTLST